MKNHNKLTRTIGRQNTLTPKRVRDLRKRLAEQRLLARDSVPTDTDS